jgi:hypothetical protein
MQIAGVKATYTNKPVSMKRSDHKIPTTDFVTSVSSRPQESCANKTENGQGQGLARPKLECTGDCSTSVSSRKVLQIDAQR